MGGSVSILYLNNGKNNSKVSLHSEITLAELLLRCKH